MKIFPRLLSLRKWFCNNKKISTKLIGGYNGKCYLELRFSSIISTEKHIPVKKFPKKILMKIFPRLLSLRKWFCNNKKISTKIIGGYNGRCYLELQFSSIISTEKHIPVKMFPKKNFDENFSKVTILEEMILQQ